MFKTRLISGIILVLIALATIICGGPVLFATLLGVSWIGMQEFYKATGVRKDGWGCLEIICYVCITVYYLAVWQLPVSFHTPALVLSVLLLMAVYVFTYPKYQTSQIVSALFGIVYVGVMLSYVLQTRLLDGGAFLVWLIFLCSWGCDTCAYCVGVLFGKHKMAPVLSPKKSVEGAVGGVIGAALLGAFYAWAIASYNPNSAHTPMIYAIICAVGALVSMVGDLAASAIKRQQKIKDYGTLIPGHGGILDRFDSVIFTAPIIYFLAMTLI